MLGIKAPGILQARDYLLFMDQDQEVRGENPNSIQLMLLRENELNEGMDWQYELVAKCLGISTRTTVDMANGKGNSTMGSKIVTSF